MTEFKMKELINGIYFDASFIDKTNIIKQLSGTGKTFLFKTMNEYCKLHDISCLYCDYRFADFSEQKILSLCEDYEMILLDNADLYLTAHLFTSLQELNKFMIISIKSTIGLNMHQVGTYAVKYDEQSLTTIRRNQL